MPQRDRIEVDLFFGIEKIGDNVIFDYAAK